MKLFLASSFDKVADLFIGKLSRKPRGLKVLFVANAADHYAEKWWVDFDRKAFKERGFAIEDVDLRALDAAQLKNGVRSLFA